MRGVTSAARGFAGACVVAVSAEGAGAEPPPWTYTIVHPSWGPHSSLRSISGAGGTERAGNVTFDAFHPHPAVWDGETAVDLLPEGAVSGFIYGGETGRQVGNAMIGGWARAAMWSGTRQSFVDLTPAGSPGGTVYATAGGVQVGQAIVGSFTRASLWHGTAASCVSLQPPGAVASNAYGTDGTSHVGSVYVNGVMQATLWTGEPATPVYLNPSWGGSGTALGTARGVQVGWARASGLEHACLWRGTAESCVDLHPDWARTSEVHAVGADEGFGLVLAGIATTWQSGTPRAVVWDVRTGAAVDLHAVLPQDRYSLSYAEAVHRDATGTYVAGLVYDVSTGTNLVRAIVWRQPAWCPADFNGDGFLDFFDYDEFVACYAGEGCSPGQTGDFNEDGFTDFFDYDAFVGAFEAGC